MLPQRMIDYIGNVSVLSLPWRLKDDADYDASCCVCERVVHIRDVRTLISVVASLTMDRRTGTGERGRVLIRDFPALIVVQGMRLEPSDDIPDVHGPTRI